MDPILTQTHGSLFLTIEPINYVVEKLVFSGRDSNDHFPIKIICVAVAVHMIVLIPMQSTFDTVLRPAHLIHSSII